MERTYDSASAGQDDMLAAARLPSDATSAVMLANLRRRLFAANDVPTVGRYVLVKEIGAGGMGVVYEAVDPRLGRKVAIKLLRPRGTGAAGQARAAERLVREAQAMATLSHPNVLPIYDVGSEDGNVYLAMELVHGGTLREWLAESERTIADIIEVFASAAAGLQAAHEAALVHRDFKPSNVLVTQDGRVFVMDFGLARSIASSSGRATTADGGVPLNDDSLTVTGTVMGSPAYMSPEQHRGEPPDPKTDQWSFCVALYESLYGKLPFIAPTMAGIRLRLMQGLGKLPARSDAVPAHLQRVIRRGLQLAPGERFVDMAALRVALTTPSRRGAVLWSAGCLLVSGVTLGLALPDSADDQPCLETRSWADDVWADSRRALLASHFFGLDSDVASATWARTESAVDEYFEDWSSAHEDVCGDQAVTGARAIQSRHECLRARLTALDEALGVIADIDPDHAARAVQTIAGLPDVADCENVDRSDRLRTSDPSDMPAARHLGALVERSKALRRAGEFNVALTLATQTLPKAEAMGATRLQVELLGLIGEVYGDLGKFDQSADHVAKAIWIAEAAQYDRKVASLAITALHTAARAAQPDEAERWAALAEAKLALFDDDGSMRARLYTRLSDAADVAGKHADAERFALLAESHAAQLDDELVYASTLLAVLRAQDRAGQLDAAIETSSRALEILERVKGEDHPEALKVRGTRAAIRSTAGQFQLSRDEIEATLPQLRRIFGEPSQPVALALGNLSNAYRGLGDNERSLDLALEALAMRREVLGDGSAVAINLYNVAIKLAEAERVPESISHYRESIDMMTVAGGAMHPFLVRPLDALASMLVAEERFDEAGALLARAFEIFDAVDAPNRERVLATFSLAQVEWGKGNEDDARALAKRARTWMLDAGAPKHRTEMVVQAIDEWLAERKAR